MRLYFPSLCILLVVLCATGAAQTPKQFLVPESTKAATAAAASTANGIDRNNSTASEVPSSKDSSAAEPAKPANPQFRIERLPIGSGAELLTIFARLDGMRTAAAAAPEVPLISVVRDTMNDRDPDNDRLRYVWMLTYARPNMAKRLASAVPFLYQDIGSQRQTSGNPPKPLMDLSNPKQQTWNRFFWMGLQNIVLDSYGLPLKASSRTYRQNASDYRSGHVMQALSILDAYERLRARQRSDGELLAFADTTASNRDKRQPVTDTGSSQLPVLAPAFSTGEMLEMRARLILSSKIFGGLAGPGVFSDTVADRTANAVDNSGHNWELLRQRAEAEGLYFEPLKMPDGQATHAILWLAKADLLAQPSREFHKRFLNIANPWGDERLRRWNGYSRTVYFDSDHRPVQADDPDAHAVEMIPLALYGLNHPKIPALVIDFRHSLNPKKREISRRVMNDLARNIFSLSNFGNLPYFVGRKTYDFVTGRRGMDINQPTRLQSYSELKLLLSFNSSIDPQLRREIERRVQNVSLNPLNNDDEAEVQLAQQQYEALINFARRPDGLAAKIERDRRAEMMPLEHGRSARIFFDVANILSFGRYVHREQDTAELEASLDKSRRITYHSRFLSEVAKSSASTDVAWDMSKVTRSLQFLADEGKEASTGAAKAAATIFEKTTDPEARRLCLEALSKINNPTARAQLLKIYQKGDPKSDLRADIAARLRKAVVEDTRIKAAEARSLLNQVGQE